MDVDLFVLAIYYVMAIPTFWGCAKVSHLKGATFWRCFLGTSAIAAVALFTWDVVTRAVFAVGYIPIISTFAVWAVGVGIPSFLVAKAWPWKSADCRPLRFAAIHFFSLSLVYGMADLFVVGTYFAPTESMQPTIKVGDYVLIDRRMSAHALALRERLGLGVRSLSRGDVTVFEIEVPDDKPGQTRRVHMLKRCVGLPREVVTVSDGNVRIGEKELPEDYRSKIRYELRSGRLRDALDPVTLGDDEYYVLGDNRDASQDSRFFGPIERASLRGRAVAIYWPPWRARWLE